LYKQLIIYGHYSNKTGATSRAGSAYPSKASEFIPGF